MVGIQIITDVSSVLIWVQTVVKGYLQMKKVTASKEKVKRLMWLFPLDTGYFVRYERSSISL